MTTQSPVWKLQSSDSSVEGEGPAPGSEPPERSCSGTQARRPRVNSRAPAALPGSASGLVEAMSSTTLVSATSSRRQSSASSLTSPIPARREERKSPAAVSGSRQPKVDTSHCCVSPSDMARCPSTDSRSSSPSSFRMQDFSEVESMSNTSLQRVSPSISKSRMAEILDCSGVGVEVGAGVSVGSGVGVEVGTGVSVGPGVGVEVGTGVSVGPGVGVDVGVSVAVGSIVGVAAGCSPLSHADRRAVAIRSSRPNHVILWTISRNLIGKGL